MHSFSARSRRASFASVAVLGTAVLLAGCAGSADAPDTAGDEAVLSGEIIWADFGGPTNEARQEIYFDPFTADTGVEVISVVVEDAIQNTMMAGGEGDYDATHVGLDQVYANIDNVLEIPEEYQDQELPEDIRPYAFGTFFVGHAQGYLTSTFPDGGPQTWADFWDVETYPGMRAWPGSPGSYDSTCEIALLADGVAPDDLYPLDLDRCTDKLDELRPNIVFYSSYPEIQQLLVSGSAAIAMGPSGQFAALRNAGEDVSVSWDQAIVAPNVIAIPKMAPNPENILALTEVFHDPELQAEFSVRTNYGPGNPDAYDHIPADVQDNLVTAPSHDTIVYQDSPWRAENTEALLNWYTGWLAS
ncbi:PotD/PotF family extracellular solute-binding protein [Microbacterium sp. 18062]|uniref:ABC transporter substrate-binding protein n=1 Tax=Microbacterium sp. 18062 TaxID=2681410 RepID=UPI0013585BF0|nr:extracellular solute-binding protein [Microbacterium sp. 18062]